MTTPAIPPEAVRLLNGFRAYQLVVAAYRLKLTIAMDSDFCSIEALTGP
jgi:hypothetical protein